MRQDDRTAFSHWIIPPYGTPTGSAEVSRIQGFYTPAALQPFGPAPGAEGRKVEPDQGRDAA